MKKIVSLLLAMLMVVSLCACGQSAPASSAAASASASAAKDYSAMSIDELKAELQTASDGKLTVATSPDFAPYEFYAIDESGNPVLSGFDVALAGYIADYLGLELEIVPMDFDGVLAELTNGTVDLGMAGLSPDPDRMDAMDFSDIYYKGGQSFVTTTANKDKFTSLEDANNPDFSIGAQTGSIQYTLAMDNTPNADVVMLTKVTDIVAELVGGKLDGAFIETAVAECYAKNYPDLYVALDVPYDTEGSAVGIAKGNAALQAAVNLAIAAALEDGSMDQFVADANDLASGSVYEGLLDNYGASSSASNG
jgi:ABC-type amino acid transport substrate-binding protein